MATKRQLKILDLFMEIYNNTSEPISSAQISSLYGKELNLKDASIRAELAKLEKEGYLQNSYKTSGRIPTTKGFEYFLDKIENTDDSKYVLKIKLEEILKKREKGINWVLKEAIKLIDVSTKPLIVTKKDNHNLYLEDLKTYHLSKDKALIVAVASNGEVFNNELDIADKDFYQLEKAINIIAKKVIGYKIADIEHIVPQIQKILKIGIDDLEDKFKTAIRNIFNRMLDVHQEVSGTNEIVLNNYFKDLDKLQILFDFVENQKIWDFLESTDAIHAHKSNVTMGVKDLEEVSIISRDIKIGKTSTSVAIVAPKGQQYKDFFTILEMIEEELNE